MKNAYKIILILLLVIVLLLGTSSILFNKQIGKEGFWSPNLIKQFNIYQTTMNNNENQFDLQLLQKQASPEEVKHLLKTGFWPWSDELKAEYIERVWSNPIIKINPQYALDYAMKLYNQAAVTELLAWNTKEGQFLLYGGNLGVSDGMPHDVNNTIKCTTDSKGKAVMQKQVFTKMNLWNGHMDSKITNLNPEDIPNEMPGFSFVRGACNPCVALNSPGDFSCPFKLNVEGDDSISSPWKKLWGL
jgi:hypothetical protein